MRMNAGTLSQGPKKAGSRIPARNTQVRKTSRRSANLPVLLIGIIDLLDTLIRASPSFHAGRKERMSNMLKNKGKRLRLKDNKGKKPSICQSNSGYRCGSTFSLHAYSIYRIRNGRKSEAR